MLIHKVSQFHTSDPKHPDRWREVTQCPTADRPWQKSFKQVLLDICKKHGDILADEVWVHLAGASADLHAADAQYHRDCYKSFVSPKNIQASQ